MKAEQKSAHPAGESGLPMGNIFLKTAAGIPVLGLLIYRTASEDRFLLKNLSGYAQYAARVRYRLVPGVW